MPDQPIQSCRRCGTCCKKGGPTLHIEDQPAVEQGLIPLKNLLTLRSGELAYDPVDNALTPLDKEIIKIRGRGQGWTCAYYDKKSDACRIYADRPFECRLLKCWDTSEFEAHYRKNRLTRKDLLANVSGLWALVADHERRCNYADIHHLLGRLGPTRVNAAFSQLAQIIRYDSEIRKLVVENGGLDPRMLDFLFGRPLTETLPPMYGLNIRLENGTVKISPNQ